MKPLTTGHKEILNSSILHEEREYWVHLPPSYDDTTFSQRYYPILYLFDAEAQFNLAASIQDYLSRGFYASIPEMIVVGILNTNRSRDLTPTHSNPEEFDRKFSFSEMGGTNIFFDMLETELFPEISNNYRTNGYRIIAGHSLGGLAVLYSLLYRDKLFNAYIAIDPSVWWDDGFLIKKYGELFYSKDFSGKALYVGSALKDFAPDETRKQHIFALSEFENILSQTNNSGLRWQFKCFEQEDHGTVVLPSQFHGLRFIFEGYQTNVKLVAHNPEMLIRSYKELSDLLQFNFLPPEHLVDGLGEYCLKFGSRENALGFFELNTQNYPDSTHAQFRIDQFQKKSE